jgi:type IV secretory pathway ATPase VirB11/archaellum biosynthesis ATPase
MIAVRDWPTVPDWLQWSDSDAATASGECECALPVADDRLLVDATGCPAGGDLASAPACRATVIAALAEGAPTPVAVQRAGSTALYVDRAADLLESAGQFVARTRIHDERLADRAERDPHAAGADAAARAGPVGEIARDTGLADAVENPAAYERVLAPLVGPTVSDARFRLVPPADARLLERRTLDTNAVVRIFRTHEDGPPTYHLTPAACRLDPDDRARLAAAHDLLARGAVDGSRRVHDAVTRVAEDGDPIERLRALLCKHTADLGVLVDCFADPAVSDVFATAPIAETPLRVRVDGRLAHTNVRLTRRGARALASRLRLESGRAFSRASPTIDAATTAGDRRVRVAGTCEPVTDGYSYTVRAHDPVPWTVGRLVDNGTLTPEVAALLSVTVARAGAVLIAGPRGAGKTTLLGALLFELAPDVRTLVIEDTPELPIEALQDRGRDVQSLLTESGEGPGLAPEAALRSALRLGEGALVLGEVRGEEAAVLYEAMRVGASGDAVLGTIHGDGPDAVRERVVEDLDVPETSFGATDLVVSLAHASEDGDRARRVQDVSEVVAGAEGVRFGALFERGEEGPSATGRIDRGNSRLVESLVRPDERYADVRQQLAARREQFARRPGVDGPTAKTGMAWGG